MVKKHLRGDSVYGRIRRLDTLERALTQLVGIWSLEHLQELEKRVKEALKNCPEFHRWVYKIEAREIVELKAVRRGLVKALLRVQMEKGRIKEMEKAFFAM